MKRLRWLSLLLVIGRRFVVGEVANEGPATVFGVLRSMWTSGVMVESRSALVPCIAAVMRNVPR